MISNGKKHGFTVVEMVVVIAVMATLVSLLIPALGMVRKMAREAKQKAQFMAIDMAIMAFKNDDGGYPESNWEIGSDYCGAQKLAEALVGWDLFGFHPDSEWKSDGGDGSGTPANLIYKSAVGEDNLDERMGPYLDPGGANAFELEDIYQNPAAKGLAPKTYVLCDSFKAQKIAMPDGKLGYVGMPILYYQANPSNKGFASETNPFDSYANNIYCSFDNELIVQLVKLQNDRELGKGPV